MDALLDHYKAAKDWICGSPYIEEVRWQEAQSLTNLDERRFLREYAWVVLNSGFRETVVRKHFDFISLCFCDWESAHTIVVNERACIQSAFAAFRNLRKLEAIASTARMIAIEGFESFYCFLRECPAETLQKLPFIGSVTSLHLAKNLGVDVAKPDRHLVRVATRYGYGDVATMCKDISLAVGDKVSVADLILWRFEASFRESYRDGVTQGL